MKASCASPPAVLAAFVWLVLGGVAWADESPTPTASEGSPTPAESAYHTLLQEPLLLCSLELVILLLGSLVEGVIISLILSRERTA